MTRSVVQRPALTVAPWSFNLGLVVFVLCASVFYAGNSAGAPGQSTKESKEAERQQTNLVKLRKLARDAKWQEIVNKGYPLAKPLDDRVSWIVAMAAEKVGRRPLAVQLFEQIAQRQGVLSNWAQLYAAELIVKGEPARAARRLSPLLSATFAGQSRAVLAWARAVIDTPARGQAVRRLRTLAGNEPAKTALATLQTLADVLERGSQTEREEAYELYRWIAVRDPQSARALDAQKKADNLLRRLPAARRTQLSSLKPEQLWTQAEALSGKRNYVAAEKAWAAVAALHPAKSKERCAARMMQGRALLYRKARYQGIALMEEIIRLCEPEDKTWARYHAGRALGALGENDKGLATYQALIKDAPNHRLSDDALYRSALLYRDLGNHDAMRKSLDTLIKRYPDGDMEPEARFLRAWSARSEGKFEQALALWSTDANDDSGEDEALRGRVLYWRAHTLQLLARKDDARRAFKELVATWPLSFYGQLAWINLKQLDPQEAKTTVEAWRSANAFVDRKSRWQSYWNDGDFRVARALAEAGESSLAMQELKYNNSLQSAESTWAAAALFYEVEELPTSCQLVRQRWRDFRTEAPNEDTGLYWRIAYPRAYHPLIEGIAQREGVPAALVRAIAREESTFDPRVVSTAQAYGLIQLIAPTAKAHAKVLGLPYDPLSLQTPDINLKIGAHFIAALWQRYQGYAGLIPPGYNAGQYAVDAWLKARPSENLDEWIENIPYDETRRYSRRVLQTYGIYRWLDQEQLPDFVLTLPKSSEGSGTRAQIDPTELN